MVTHSPEVVPVNEVDVVYKWDNSSVAKVASSNYDIAINLDKDREACMLLSLIKAQKKFVFYGKMDI